MTMTNMKNLNAIMAKMTSQHREKEYIEGDLIHDIGASRPASSVDKCMTLTKSRCMEGHGYYSSKRPRPLDVADFLRLNGIKASRFEGWTDIISRSRMGGMCGNGEALNVLTPIIKAVLQSIGMTNLKNPDWATMDMK